MLKRVSVIIPNWNGRELLGPCLETLYRQQFDDFETVLVDNGSTDGSVSFVETHFPQVTIVRLEENRGFSAAVNAGISASASPYICLLNNDTEVDPRWLGEIVTALDANPDVGAAASKILFFSDRTTVNSAGDQFSLFGVAYQRRLTHGDVNLFSVPQYVFSACGAAALYRRRILEKVGLFDEVFFAYQEDVDLGFRIQLAGYHCLFVPTAIVYHKYHATSSRNSNLWFYLRERNKYFILIKNLSGKLLFLCFPLVLLQEVFSFFEAFWRGHIGAYCRARRDLWSYLPHLLRERRVIQACRVVNDVYVLGLMRFWEPLSIAFYSFRALLTLKQQQMRSIS
jgi:GT2 family glycosyltransferase